MHIVEKLDKRDNSIELFHCASKAKAQAAKRQLKYFLNAKDELHNYRIEVRKQ